jgi:hypothetical protein
MPGDEWPWIVQQVAAVFFGRGLEEVVEADVIQRGAGRESGDVAAQIRILHVGAHDHRQCVPANDRTDAAFHEQVAGHACFAGNRDGVAVRRGDGVRQLCTTSCGQPGRPAIPGFRRDRGLAWLAPGRKGFQNRLPEFVATGLVGRRRKNSWMAGVVPGVV